LLGLLKQFKTVNNKTAMDLQIFESKYGTKVVAASNLYQSLGLPAAQYGARVRKWLKDLYEFREGIRRPQPLRDYAKRPRPGEPMEDFFLALELAKLIALRTNSKQKLKYARLLDLIAQNGQMDLFQHGLPDGTAQPPQRARRAA
jgi:hypothetical protein